MAEFKNELILQDASGVKVSIDLRNSLVLSSAPTSATKARIGMQAYVVSGGAITAEYVCTAVSGSVYTWVLREGPGQAESGETFVATYGVTTYADVKAAVDAKKAVFAYYSDDMYCFSNATNNIIQFVRIVTGNTNAYFVNVKNDNTWDVTSHGLQKTENLVRSIGASSSDTQYPSAKAVYDFVMANGSGGGSGGTFVAVYGETSYEDVRAAYDAGQPVIVMEGTKVYQLSQVGTLLMRFDYSDSSVHSRVMAHQSLGWSKTDTAITGGTGGIVESVSGETLILPDAIEAPILGLSVYGKSTQNGTPSSGVPVPIVSAFENYDSVNLTGKNLLRGAPVTYTTNGMSAKANADGSVTVSGSVASTGDVILYFFNSSYAGDHKKIWLRPGGKVSCSLYKDGVKYTEASTTVRYKDKDGKNVYMVTKEVYVDAIYIQPKLNAGDTSLCGTYWIQLEFNKTETAYEPYKGCQSIPVTTPLCGVPVASGGNYTDSSGQQWVCDEIDFGRGVKVQRTKRIRYSGAAGESWSRQNSSSPYVFRENALVKDNKQPASNEDVAQMLCDKFNITKQNLIYNTATVDAISMSGSQKGIYVKPSGFTGSTVEEFTAWLASNPFEVVYILDTPIETPLTDYELAAYAELHTNEPVTTIYADVNAGLAVTYKADTKRYVDKKFDALAAAIINNA